MVFFRKKKTFKIRDVEFYSDDQYHYSKGLKSSIEKEIRIFKNNISLEELRPLLRYIIEFIEDEKPSIKNGKRITCFSWSILFNEIHDFFEILEIIPEQKGFAEGLTRTLFILNRQLEVCNQVNAEPDFPFFDNAMAADPLIKTGLPVHLFRWSANGNDSGWVAMTDQFDENTMSFDEITVGQLMTAIPETIQFMALPKGFKVIRDRDGARIAFDEHLLQG